MKKILFVLSLFVFVTACKQDKKEVIKDITFSGKIENAKGDSLMIRKDDTTQKFAIAEDGSFSGTVNGGSGFYQMRYKRKRANLYFDQGQETIMNTNFEAFDSTLVFTGTGAAVNNYLKSKGDLADEFSNEIPMKDLYSMDEDAFQEKINAYEKRMLNHLNSANLPEAFSAMQAKNIGFEVINNKVNFESYHQYFAKDEEFKVSDTYNAQFDNLDFDNDADFKSVPQYNSLVVGHFTDGELDENLTSLESVKSPAIKDAVLKVLYNYFLSPGTDDLKGTVDKMKSLTSNEELIGKISESYDKMVVLTKGNDSPGFEYKNVAGNLVNLKDLKGKNVYIDVWATWCGPCKAEIPHLKELEKSYHDKNVEFVSISVDVPEDEDKWKSMIADKDLKGVQLLSDNGWDTDFVNNYLIKGIPRFILLDDEGKIVTADAPRPSSDQELKDMLNALL